MRRLLRFFFLIRDFSLEGDCYKISALQRKKTLKFVIYIAWFKTAKKKKRNKHSFSGDNSYLSC